MMHYKRILAAIGSAALLISNLGAIPQTVFAGEQITENVEIDANTDTHSEDAGDTGGGKAADDTGSPGTTATDKDSGSGGAGNTSGNTGNTSDGSGGSDGADGGNTSGGNAGTDTSGGSTNTSGGMGGSDSGKGNDDSSDDTGGGGTDATDPDGKTTDTGDDKNSAAGQVGTDTSTAQGEKGKKSDTDNFLTYEETLDDITIHAEADPDVIPKGSALKVAWLGDDELSDVEQQLDDSDITYDGYIAMDIHFEDSDGETIEPQEGSVKVTFDIDTKALDDDYDPTTLEVQHFDNSGDELQIVTVADTTDRKDTGNITPSSDTDTSDDKPEAVTAEFTVGSFSTFTVTWRRNNGQNTTSIDFNCQLENGDALPEGKAPSSQTLDSNNSIQFSRQTISGYDYVSAVITVGNTTITNATHIRAYYDSGNEQWTYSYRISGSTRYTSLSGKPSITLIYKRQTEQAKVYALKTPSMLPGSNQSENWTSSLGVATVDTTDATWEWSSETNSYKNINTNVSDYIVSWPDGSTGANWTLNSSSSGSYFNNIRSEILSAYRTHLQDKLGITNLTANDIKTIILTPYKISRDNNDDPDKHIDCTISVTCEKKYKVVFNVKDVDATGYAEVKSDDTTYDMRIVDVYYEGDNYKGSDTKAEADAIQDPGAIVPGTDSSGNAITYNIGDTKVVNGVTYRLSGWYTENASGGARSDKTADFSNGGYVMSTKEDRTNHITSIPELDDYVVNLYAEWEVVTGELEVGKTVDATDGFYTAGDSYNIDVTLHNVAKDSDGEYIVSQGQNTVITLTIKDGESQKLTGIPSGTTYSIEEQAASGTDKGFNVTYAYYDSSGKPVSAATGQVIEPDKTVKATVTNTKKVVRTGVSTTNTPMTALLAAITMALIGTTAYIKAKRYVH